MKKIYIAGPSVFFQNWKEHEVFYKKTLKKYNLKGLYPMDNTIDPSITDPSTIAKEIWKNNIKLIEKSDGIIADYTPFRGASLDSGTAYEVGYAQALNKPVIGWTNEKKPYFERVEKNQNNPDIDPNQNTIENFGLIDNLMLCSDVLFYKDFENAAMHMSKILEKK